VSIGKVGADKTAAWKQFRAVCICRQYRGELRLYSTRRELGDGVTLAASRQFALAAHSVVTT
jgi:hypothetical protein